QPLPGGAARAMAPLPEVPLVGGGAIPRPSDSLDQDSLALAPRAPMSAVLTCRRWGERVPKPAQRQEPDIRELFHEFDLARPPLLREEGFEWTVEAQDCEPTFAGHGLNPVPALDTRWLAGTEVNRR